MKDRMHSLKCWKALTIHAIEILKYRDKNAEPRELGIHNITYSFNDKMTGRILNNEIRKKVLSQINKCHNEGAYI